MNEALCFLNHLLAGGRLDDPALSDDRRHHACGGHVERWVEALASSRRHSPSRTPSGVIATRYSCVLISLGTPTVMIMGAIFGLVEPLVNGCFSGRLLT